MIAFTGQLICSNCRKVSPRGADYLHTSALAAQLGWLSISSMAYGCVSINHFCPLCHEAARRAAQRASTTDCQSDSGGRQ